MIVSRSQLLNALFDCRWPQELLVKRSTTQPCGIVKILASDSIYLIQFNLSTINIQWLINYNILLNPDIVQLILYF